jgi:hypothetical protein
VREAFQRLAAAQTAYLKQKITHGVERWMRRFFLSFDTAHELNCRNVLSSRFRHWHHATHAQRHTTHFRGKLEDLHASLVRTTSNLQEEMARKRAMEEEAARTQASLRASLMKSRLRVVNKIVGIMTHRQAARGFRSWALYCKWHAHQQELRERALSEHTQRAQRTMLRWLKRTSTLNLSTALHIWHLAVSQMGRADTMLRRRHKVMYKRVFAGWQEMVRENQLQRRCIKRMIRQKQYAQVAAAWDTWTSKVRKLKQTCKTFIKLLLSKRRDSCMYAIRRWRHNAQEQVLYEERDNRARLEEAERQLTLRLHWSHFQLGVEMFRRDKRHMIQLVVNKIQARVRDGFDRWFHYSQRMSKLRSICLRFLTHYAHSLGKQHFLAFARWKAAVWDYQKICFAELQDQLADAHQRIVTITEQQLVLEGNSEHLRRHNERADRIARTLYHQVHRMLSSRRLYGTVRLVFDTWKRQHEFIRRCKTRMMQYFIRSHATVNTLEMAAAFRTWVVAAHAIQKEENEMKLATDHANRLVLHRFFARWQTYRSVRRMQMMVGIHSFFAL